MNRHKPPWWSQRTAGCPIGAVVCVHPIDSEGSLTPVVLLRALQPVYRHAGGCVFRQRRPSAVS